MSAAILIPGAAAGPVLRLDASLSFWGGVDPATATISLAGHPQQGTRITGKILVIPQLVGSSSSSAVMLELLHRGTAPAALILAARDAILPVGVIAARQMGWPTIPVLVAPGADYATGDTLEIHMDGRIEKRRPAP